VGIVRQLAVWAVGAAVLRVVVVPAETCPAIESPTIRRSVDAAATWLVRGQGDDGRFLYGYSFASGEVSDGYNSTRHAGVVDVLYRAGRVRAADAGLEYVLDNLVDHDGWTAFAPAGENANVGANALVLAALVHRRLATGDRSYDDLTRRIARFLVAQQRPDGSTLKYWSPAIGRPVPGVFGRFSTGEAFWALALVHRLFPDEGWERPAHRVGVYLATRRDEVEGDMILEADHWAAYGLAELAPAGLTEAEAAYARRLAGHFGYLIRLESQHEGSALNPMIESGSSLGTLGEGTAALWRLAGTDGRLAGLRDDLGERATCLAGILVEQQVGPEAPSPRERGAWFDDGYTQMDDQQHAIAALLGAREVLG
jgi:hypothetical protein